MSNKDFITPVMPNAANLQMNAWERDLKAPAFVKVQGQSGEKGDCKNCAGLSFIYIFFCGAGPFTSPPGGRKPITYFEGNGQFGKGWWVIENTVAYPCPQCRAGQQLN